MAIEIKDFNRMQRAEDNVEALIKITDTLAEVLENLISELADVHIRKCKLEQIKTVRALLRVTKMT